MQSAVIVLTISGIIGSALLACILRMTWLASEDKQAEQRAANNAKTASIQRRADEVAARSFNSDGDLERELENGTY